MYRLLNALKWLPQLHHISFTRNPECNDMRLLTNIASWVALLQRDDCFPALERLYVSHLPPCGMLAPLSTTTHRTWPVVVETDAHTASTVHPWLVYRNVCDPEDLLPGMRCVDSVCLGKVNYPTGFQHIHPNVEIAELKLTLVQAYHYVAVAFCARVMRGMPALRRLDLRVQKMQPGAEKLLVSEICSRRNLVELHLHGDWGRDITARRELADFVSGEYGPCEMSYGTDWWRHQDAFHRELCVRPVNTRLVKLDVST